MRVDDTTPTPFTVTREGDGLTADCGTGPRFFYADEQTDASLERIRDGVQAVLDRRAQERQVKAEERAAGVRALLKEAGYPPEFIDAEDEAAEARIVGKLTAALYDKGHRAKSTSPAESRPFQVGDVVRISDDAMTGSRVTGGTGRASAGRGETGTVIRLIDTTGEAVVKDVGGDMYYLPEVRFLTLVTPAATP